MISSQSMKKSIKNSLSITKKRK